MSNKKLLFSITKKDFNIQFFRAGGKGGQKQNKTSSACRIIHKNSGAVGECREERSQHQNKKIAFNRLVKSEKFQNWLRVESAARIQGFADVEDKVNKSLVSKNLKIEIKDDEGEWKENKE